MNPKKLQQIKDQDIETSIRNDEMSEYWERKFDKEFEIDVYCLKCNNKTTMDSKWSQIQGIKDYIARLLKEEYKNGYNQCLKEQGKVGEEHQHLYL